MIYNIPEWPADSDVNHTATTWVLARDKDFENIEDELDESEDALLVWEIDKIIPTGDIWFIKALRKLEDDDGKDLNNTKWIGPKPVFNEESNTNEYLAPKFYVDTPYITDIIYVDGESLEIKITPFKSNVGYANTILVVEDNKDNVLLAKYYNVVETENSLLIENSELDFTDLDDVKIYVVHNAGRSTTSAPVIEVFNLKNAHFKIKGNTKEIDPTYNNKLKVISTTLNNVSAKKAMLENRSGVIIEELVVENNEIFIKNNLEFKKEYILRVTVEFTKADGNTDTTEKVIVITTRDNDEIVNKRDNVTYEDNFAMVSSTEYDSDVYNYDLDKSFNTEEFFTYSIPVPDTKNDDISLFGLDKDDYLISKHIESIIDLDKEFTIRLLTKTKGLINTIDDDNIVILTPFVFDPYADTIILEDSITTDFISKAPFVNKIAQQPTGIFIAGIDKDDKTLLKIKEYDVNNKTLKDSYTYKLDAECEDVAVCESGMNNVLLIPYCTTDDVIRTCIFSPIENYVNKSVTIPTELRGKNLLVNKLYNGNVIIFKHNETDDGFNYGVFDNKTETIEITEVDIGSDTKTITNLISLKNGNILSIVKNENNDGTAIAEFWLYN